MFIDYIGTMRGWGRGLRKAVGNWYTQRPVTDAVYQAVKYRSRYNWTHRDLLRKAHPNAIDPQMDALFAWITKGTLPLWDEHPDLRLILAYEDAKTAGPNDLARLIELRQLTWEMVPSEMLDKEVVWRALGRAMPMTALLRNLATLTRVGVIAPMDSAWVCEILKKIGTMNLIHSIAVLTAAGIPSRQGGPWASHLDACSPGDRRSRCRLRPLVLTGPPDEPAALSGNRCVWLDG